MEVYQTVINLEKHCGRAQDVFNFSRYPTNVWNAKGVLVKEDKQVIPSYQPMPTGLLAIADTAGLIDKEARENMYRRLGVFDPPEKMYTLRKLVNGLICGHNWGPTLYFSTLVISNDLNSKEPRATAVDSPEWDYLFKPGMFRLGKTGRVLVDSQGRQFQEELYIEITPDLVYDNVTNGGIHLAKVGIIKDNGEVAVVYDYNRGNNNGIEDKFPEPVSLKGKYAETNFKTIDLTKIVESEGMRVRLHPFTEQIAAFTGIYIFRPRQKFEHPKTLADTFGLTTDNVVWKFASLDYLAENPNTFFHPGMHPFEFKDGYFTMHDSHFSFGSTGRDVKIAERYVKEHGFEAPSNWQMEYVGLNIERNMLIAALFGLGNELQRLIMSGPKLEDPWEIVHEPARGIDLKNKVTIPQDSWWDRKRNQLHKTGQFHQLMGN